MLSNYFVTDLDLSRLPHSNLQLVYYQVLQSLLLRWGSEDFRELKQLVQTGIGIVEPKQFNFRVRMFCTCAQSLSHVQHFAAPWTVAQQALLSVGLSRQEYWSGLPFSPPGELPNPGTEPESVVSPALAGQFFTTEPSGKPPGPFKTVLYYF